MQEKVEAVIAEYIRPLIEADGGQVELVEVTDDRVVIRLSGTCNGCPGQPYTLQRIIEPVIKRAVGSAVTVEARVTSNGSAQS